MAAARLTLAVAVLVALLAEPASAATRPHAPSVVGDRAVEPGDSLTVLAGVRADTAAKLRLYLSGATGNVLVAARRVRGSRRAIVVQVPSLAPGLYRVLACTSRCRAGLLRVRVVARPVPIAAPPPLPAPPLPPLLPLEPPPPEPQPRAEPPEEPEPPALAPFGPACGPDGLLSERLDAAAAPASPAADFTALFAASRRGYTGGDGALSVPLPAGEVAWLFGDTFLGGIRTDGTRDPQSLLVRNAMVLQDGDCLVTIPSPAEAPPGEWYWPARGAVSGDGQRLHTFWTRLRATGDGTFDFEVTGTALLTHALPSLEQEGDLVELPSSGRLFFGAAIVERVDATYVYGVDEATPHRLHVARATTGDLAGPLEFWDGAAWATDVKDSAPILDAEVATQLSVVDRGTDLVLVSQPPFEADVEAWTAADPRGPWTAAGTIATLPLVPGAWTYNAVLHPWSQTTDGLLLGYSVHPVDGADLHTRPDLYRPRFTRVALPGRSGTT
ncbi:MAG TPA: DUF4185 domain-containing protein [Solirubrobacteraceae bacterium]|nr:DUF4185 domain-containing protein [Solirubrobacteraceae bacterium]